MTNEKLLRLGFKEKLETMGFTYSNDGTEDPRGDCWIFENNLFMIYVDAWGEVSLSRKNPDTDPILLHIDELFDLQRVIDWIEDEDDENNYVCVSCEKHISRNETSSIYLGHCIICEKIKKRIAELEEQRQILLNKYKNLPDGEDSDSLASEIVTYKMIIMELEKTIIK